jgi:hypothetical protein
MIATIATATTIAMISPVLIDFDGSFDAGLDGEDVLAAALEVPSTRREVVPLVTTVEVPVGTNVDESNVEEVCEIVACSFLVDCSQIFQTLLTADKDVIVAANGTPFSMHLTPSPEM